MTQPEDVWSATPTGRRTPPAPWVSVPGRVLRLNGRGVGGWTIGYPLPDGSAAELTVAYTRPSALREGMTVPVLVNPQNPREARLDYAPHDRVRNAVVLGVVAVFAFALLALGAMAALFFALYRL